jgi:hypothetical protein
MVGGFGGQPGLPHTERCVRVRRMRTQRQWGTPDVVCVSVRQSVSTEPCPERAAAVLTASGAHAKNMNGPCGSCRASVRLEKLTLASVSFLTSVCDDCGSPVSNSCITFTKKKAINVCAQRRVPLGTFVIRVHYVGLFSHSRGYSCWTMCQCQRTESILGPGGNALKVHHAVTTTRLVSYGPKLIWSICAVHSDNALHSWRTNYQW